MFISKPFEKGLNRDRGLFNLEKTMVSVLHKELEYKVGKSSSTRRLEVMQPRIRIRSEQNHPGLAHTKFYSRD